MPAAPATTPPPSDTLTVDIDVQTVMALVRANTRAMAALSPDFQKCITEALGEEIRLQEIQEGPVSRLVIAMLKDHLAELA